MGKTTAEDTRSFASLHRRIQDLERELAQARAAYPQFQPAGNLPEQESQDQQLQQLVTRLANVEQVNHALAYQSTLLQNVHDAIVGIDNNFTITYWNKAAEALYGWTAEEALGRSLKTALNCGLSGKGRAQVLQSILEGQAPALELVQHGKDGRRLVVEATAIALRRPDGHLQGYVAAVRDITESKALTEQLTHQQQRLQETQAQVEIERQKLTEIEQRLLENQHRLQENEERLRLADEAAGLGTWEWQPGWDYSINNDTYFEIHGLPPSPDHRVQLGPYLKRVHPEDRAHLVVSIKRAVEGKPCIDLPFRFIRPDGSVRWIQSYRKNIYKNGRLIRQIGAVRDITGQVRYEEELRAANRALQTSQQQVRLLVDSMDDVVFTLDTRQRHTGLYGRSVNSYGIAPEMFIGKTPAEILGEEYAQTHVEANLKALTGQNVVYEWSPPASARKVQFQTRLSPMRDELGEIIGIVGVSRDISQLKHTQSTLEEYARKLEHSNQELQEFAYVASHDLQEPLRKVNAFGNQLVSMLEGRLTRDEQQLIDRMLMAITRLQEMITDLLNLSQVTTQGQPFQPVALNEVAKIVVSDLEVQLAQTHGLVEIGELPNLEADPNQMHRLLLNLIGNGLKYHRQDAPPEVKVAGEVFSTQGRDMAQLRVEDNGIGFDMQNLDRIFQPFQRLHGRSQYAGSGIGLAICKKIVERHGGTITANSQPGTGSTFIITLPVRRP